MSEPRHPDTKLPLVAVFEAINDSLRETYVGTTALPHDAVAFHFRNNLPPAAAHWRTEQKVIVNIVEDSLRLNDALDFIQHYAASLEAVGWRALREDG